MKAILTPKIVWTSLFAIAFALVEAAVVVYLRGLYYPEGFVFPLKLIAQPHLVVELAREFSTIVMLLAVGVLAGGSRWQKFSYFMIAFGIWDIFYYVWLKVFLSWPQSLTDWDILFLIPIPWIGPVIAPIAISVLMIIAGWTIIRREEGGISFSPPSSSWVLGGIGTAVVLFTFLRDTGATLQGGVPEPFWYWLFGIGAMFYAAALFVAVQKSRGKKGDS